MALAADPATPDNTPTVELTPGKQVEAIFPNGRRAIVRWHKRRNLIAPVQFQVTENLCASGISGVDFVMHFALRMERLKWIWTAHEDATKIGQVLKSRAADGTLFPLQTTDILSNAERWQKGTAVPDMPDDEIEFSASGLWPEKGSGPIDIETWTTEGMLPNSQTGISENMIVGMASGVRLELQGTGRYAITRIDSLTNIFGGADPFGLLGAVVGWTQRENDQLCLISTKPALGPALAILDRYIAEDDSSLQDYFYKTSRTSNDDYFFTPSSLATIND